jgi:hypothetical protein
MHLACHHRQTRAKDARDARVTPAYAGKKARKTLAGRAFVTLAQALAELRRAPRRSAGR